MIKVVKIGGNVVDNPELLREFVKDFAAIPGMKILVHGGGVMASQMQKSMGMSPRMIEGRRVTDEETLKIVTMVYAGWCNKNITALLQAYGCNAIGLTGADGNAIKASKRPPVYVESMGEDVDYGYVGDVTAQSVNASFIYSLISRGIVPVFNAINHDGNGNLLNTNADTIASSLAIAMANYKYRTPREVCCRCEECTHCCDDGRLVHETELIYCFEKDGVLYDKDDDASVIPEIDKDKFADGHRQSEDYIVFVGRLSKEKGIENIAATAKLLPRYSFVVAGSGPDGAVLQDLPNVRLAGFLTGEKLTELIGKAKVLLLPSVCYENCPLTILEAHCMGVPVVTMNSGGMAELVKDGVTGSLVTDPTPEGIAAALQRTLENEEYYNALRMNCKRERDSILSVETYGDILIGEYEKLAAR